MENRVLGVDVGGVLIASSHDRADTSFFSERYLDTPEVEDALKTLGELAGSRRFAAIHLVSKCGPSVQAKTLNWLQAHDLFERCVIPAENIWFCRERHEKAPICEALQVTDFIDDRLEVLSHLTSVNRRILFRPSPAEVERFSQFLPEVRVVHAWSEARDVLIG